MHRTLHKPVPGKAAGARASRMLVLAPALAGQGSGRSHKPGRLCGATARANLVANHVAGFDRPWPAARPSGGPTAPARYLHGAAHRRVWAVRGGSPGLPAAHSRPRRGNGGHKTVATLAARRATTSGWPPPRVPARRLAAAWPQADGAGHRGGQGHNRDGPCAQNSGARMRTIGTGTANAPYAPPRLAAGPDMPMHPKR